MKIAAHVLAYNVNRFIKPVIENLENNVDKIYIAYSDYPWSYNAEKKELFKNTTTLEYLYELKEKAKCEVEIIVGEWNFDEDQRNTCLKRAREENFDWLIIQDADEFYTEESWEEIKEVLRTNTTHDHFKTTWYNFWKSSKYVIQYPNNSIKGSNAGFALRCNSDLYFIRSRSCSQTDKSMTLDIPCFHYGYIHSNKDMYTKINTWAHANDFFTNREEWFLLKYENWTLQTKYLNISHPINFKRAIEFPFAQPHFAKQFETDDYISNTLSLDLKFKNLIYDVKAYSYAKLRIFKRFFIKGKNPIKMT
jgi:hypothetical protein